MKPRFLSPRAVSFSLLLAFLVLPGWLAAQDGQKADLVALGKQLAGDPNNVELLMTIASLYAEEERFDDAIPLVSKVLTLQPDNIDAHGALCMMYSQKGDTESSQKELAAVGKLDKDMAKDLKRALSLASLGKVMEAGGPDTPVIKQLKEAAAKNPQEFVIFLGIGEAYLNLTRYQEAAEHFRKAASIAPRDARVVYDEGLVAAYLKDFTAAQKKHDELLTLGDKDVDRQMANMLAGEIERLRKEGGKE